jgi:hypothetical protein
VTELLWFIVNAGTPDGSEGERRGRIRATSAERATELYLSQRPASWVVHEIRPATADEVKS